MQDADTLSGVGSRAASVLALNNGLIGEDVLIDFSASGRTPGAGGGAAGLGKAGIAGRQGGVAPRSHSQGGEGGDTFCPIACDHTAGGTGATGATVRAGGLSDYDFTAGNIKPTSGEAGIWGRGFAAGGNFHNVFSGRVRTPGGAGGRGGDGGDGARGQDGGTGGGGAGGTVFILSSVLDVGGVTVSAGGGMGQTQSFNGDDGMVYFGSNGADDAVPTVAAGRVGGGPGRRRVSTFLEGKPETPFLPDIFESADLFGVTTTLDARSPFFDPFLLGAEQPGGGLRRGGFRGCRDRAHGSRVRGFRHDVFPQPDG